MIKHDAILRRIRALIAIVIFGLIASGITAFPLLREMELIAAWRGIENQSPAEISSGFDHWILVVRDGLRDTYNTYPWVAYGTDWLAFAHLASRSSLSALGRILSETFGPSKQG